VVAFLSVCLSNAWIVTKRKKFVPTFLYHMKDRSLVRRRMVGGRRPLLPAILGQTDSIGAKMSIFNRYSLIVP